MEREKEKDNFKSRGMTITPLKKKHAKIYFCGADFIFVYLPDSFDKNLVYWGPRSFPIHLEMNCNTYILSDKRLLAASR